MNTPTDKSLPAQAAYCRAYSVFLIDGAEEPKAEVFGISEEMAEVLRRQCRSMAHRQFDAKAPAVSFTKAEAGQAAASLRDIAATCCELGHVEDEKILRLLAQKFDGKEDNE